MRGFIHWTAIVTALLLAACGGGREEVLAAHAPQSKQPPRGVVAGPLDAGSLFTWAEEAFPALFPAGPSTETAEPYAYRAYASGNYLGAANGSVWIYGPLSGGQLTAVAPLSAFDCLAEPARCAQQAIRVPNVAGSGNYPLSYMLAGDTFTSMASVCDTVRSTIEFPAHYMGLHRLPTPTGAPLPASIQRVAAMKDVWAANNPTFENGCQGSARDAFLITLERLKAMNIQEVTVTPWTDVDNSQATWRIKNPAETQSSTISDEDLAWIAARVKEAGMKIVWVNQIQTVNMITPPPATPENINKFFDAFEPYILERAALAKQLGIDAMSIDCMCWMMSNRALADQRMATIAPKIRQIYAGKLFYPLHNTTPDALKASIDESLFSYFTAFLPLTEQERSNLSVGLIKGKALNTFQGLLQTMDPSKPMRVLIHFPSRSDLFTTGYLEETFCTAGYNDLSGENATCIQRSTPTDFSVQALLHQAALAAIKEQPYWNISAVHAEYWHTDGIAPGSTFPNLAVSIRNKPAEAIVRSWFAAP